MKKLKAAEAPCGRCQAPRRGALRGKVLLPTAILFASPWSHKLIYLNLMEAWPNMLPVVAHSCGAFGALIAFGATAIIVSTQ